mmetsp:Transcript_59544/g.70956  ORF Transcript_59544/g.70956 Transcript_59544/m.70956 type:complete len:1038 (+) Transcript_59544:183-3296(+)|eukprot:CAMPEP_0172500878 /NCGR_PEP_ID=MMETSP1066-20121228/143959_1 /TAXON_ID=671091 /ORGANISM="Coscinodiscus wailesii, Strain CCMP2513" /LENGTH=1037 /DNA_ID=CAMNT_0013275359 /DNA_START=781 /DNA_END=3894 /DNA_ORIENTATION=-
MPPSIEADAVPSPPSREDKNHDNIIPGFSNSNDDVMNSLSVSLANANLNHMNSNVVGGNGLFTAKNFGVNTVSFSSATSGDGSRVESPSSFSAGGSVRSNVISYGTELKTAAGDRGIDGLNIHQIPPYSTQMNDPIVVNSDNMNKGGFDAIFNQGSQPIGGNLLNGQFAGQDNISNQRNRNFDSYASAPSSGQSLLSGSDGSIGGNNSRTRDPQRNDLYAVVSKDFSSAPAGGQNIVKDGRHKKHASKMTNVRQHGYSHAKETNYDQILHNHKNHTHGYNNNNSRDNNGYNRDMSMSRSKQASGAEATGQPKQDQMLWRGHHGSGNQINPMVPLVTAGVEMDNKTRLPHQPNMFVSPNSSQLNGHVAPVMAPVVVNHDMNGSRPSQHQPNMYSVPPYDQNMRGGMTTPNISMPPSHAQQLFYMAVPMQNGQGQVLQPVQVVQLPNGHSTLVVPATGHPVHVTEGRQDNINQQNQAIASGSVVGEMSLDQLNFSNRGIAESNLSQYSNRHPVVPSMANYPVHSGNEVNRKRDKRSNKNKVPQFQDKPLFNTTGHPRNDVLPHSTQPYIPPPTSGNTNSNTGHINSLDNQQSSAKNTTCPSPVPSEAINALYHSNHRPPLSALLGHVRRLSRDQVGCRLLQQSLDEDDSHAATAILHEGLPFIAETMTDPFGNYLFQKILEKITAEERLLLIRTVSPRLVNAALNLHGTRSVQKVVEMTIADDATPRQKDAAAEAVTKSLTPAAARLCIDSHGNHVIQRILLRLPHKHSKFVFDAVANSVGDVARHRHGCCVIQRCLDSPSSLARSNLVRRIVEKALDLMQDAYGNYVVQYVLDVCGDEEAAAVCESVIGKVGLLAIQKFSSNVMEKCLERSSDWVQDDYLRELSMPDKIRELMTDPFGNYVVQRALSVATHAQAVRLVEAMRPHLTGIRNTAGGRRIVAKICRRFPNFSLNVICTNGLMVADVNNNANANAMFVTPPSQQHHHQHQHQNHMNYHRMQLQQQQQQNVLSVGAAAAAERQPQMGGVDLRSSTSNGYHYRS